MASDMETRKKGLSILFKNLDEVDLVEKAALRNPFRRYSILRSKEVIYAV